MYHVPALHVFTWVTQQASLAQSFLREGDPILCLVDYYFF